MKQYSNQLRMSHRIIVSDIWIRVIFPGRTVWILSWSSIGSCLSTASHLPTWERLHNPKGGYLNFLEGIPSLRVNGNPQVIQLQTPKVKWHLAVHLVHCYCRHHQWDYLGAVLRSRCDGRVSNASTFTMDKHMWVSKLWQHVLVDVWQI